MFKYFRDIFSSANDPDPDAIKLLRTVLMVSAAGTAIMAALMLLLTGQIGLGFKGAATVSVLTGAMLFLSYRNIHWPGRLLFPLIPLAAITFLAVSSDGLHDSTITAYFIVIVFAGMLAGQKAIPPATVLTLMGIWIVSYADMTGINKSVLAPRTQLADVVVISIIQIIAAASLNGLMARLNSALSVSRNNEQAQIKSNQELSDLQAALEQRVADATRNLTLAAEVGQRMAQVHDLDALLKQAAELIQERFGLYYTQVYLLDPTGRRLNLRAGTGEVGQLLLSRRHNLAVDLASLNGTAVLEQSPVIVEDTATSLIHRANPLLPDTRSEMVVPLMSGEDVILGTLDMQSSQTGILNKENLAAFQTLAGQLAVAIENASLLAETEAARAALEAQSRRLVHSGWEEFLNAVERGERIGYTFDQEKIEPYAESVTPEPDGRSLVKAIPVSNEPVGALRFEGNQLWSEEDTALVDSIAHQLGQQVENLRLIAQADQYRAEAENALRRLTRQGWEEEIAIHNGARTGFTYDLNVITPLDGDKPAGEIHPLEVMGEKVGELAVAGANSQREDVLELLNSVGEQLSARVENLRLLEEAERSQVEVEKRARQLAAVAEVSTVSSREMNVDKMLHSVVHLTQRQFGLYHAHIFLYDEKTEELKIAACGWKEGDVNEGTDGTTTISIDQEQSLVARAARTRQAVIVNDVKSEPGWLSNPTLPDTASELAVPLFIGEKVLGVLDVQSEHLNAFSEEDANIQTTLASQVAIALQNARSFSQAQQQAEREALLNTIGQKIRSATSVEAVLQIAARELGRALGAPLTVAQLGLKKENK